MISFARVPSLVLWSSLSLTSGIPKVTALCVVNGFVPVGWLVAVMLDLVSTGLFVALPCSLPWETMLALARWVPHRCHLPALLVSFLTLKELS